mgnify:CR=1 FL=1
MTIAFGLRNFADLDRGLKEIRRVLAPGGTLLALEFSMELSPWFALLYRPYFRHVLPRIGRWISGTDAYTYLHESVERFPPTAEFRAALVRTGFARPRTDSLSGGSVALHAAETAARAS